jgi:hypothetical protein
LLAAISVPPRRPAANTLQHILGFFFTVHIGAQEQTLGWQRGKDLFDLIRRHQSEAGGGEVGRVVMASGSGCEVQAARTSRKKRNASFMDLACRSNLVDLELRQVVLVDGEQLIGHVPYLRQREHGGWQ